MNDTTSQRGQILILVVLVLVGLLGITALAVDGGRVYADRRYDQNASDASALNGGSAAAAYLEAHSIYFSSFNCSAAGVLSAMQDAANAAIIRAATRNFSIDTDVSDQHGVQVTCVDTARDKHLDIRVLISSTTDTAFAQLFTNQPLRNTVEAIVRIKPRQPLVFGNAIVALDPGGCDGHQNGAIAFGGARIDVTGGGIFTNGCLRENGGPNVWVTGAGINHVGELVGDPNAFHPPAQQVPDPIPPESYQVPWPTWCDNLANQITDTEFKALSPVPAGLYCIKNGLRVNANENLDAHDVTIAIVSGDVTFNGSASSHLDAPPRDPDPSPALPGVLIMLKPGNNSDVTLNGSSDSTFEGLIFAPQSYVKLIGTGNTNGYHTQIIGWDVEIGGNANTNITYDEDQQFLMPPALDLVR